MPTVILDRQAFDACYVSEALLYSLTRIRGLPVYRHVSPITSEHVLNWTCEDATGSRARAEAIKVVTTIIIVL